MTSNKDNALLPARFITDPAILQDPANIYADSSRRFQGIPSIESTAGGRLFTVFYTGTETEGNGNFLLIHKSDDGEHFGDAILAVTPPTEDTRCYDPTLWRDPDGRLWLCWAQSYGWYDGRMGVWCAICDEPDGDEIRFSAPRRVANGIMMNKPTVLQNGDWLFPCAVWCTHTAEQNHLPEERYSNVYRSTDKGKTFTLWGHSDVPDRGFDEHMVYERTDGTLVMLVRANYGIGQAFSKDGGKTWFGEGDSGLGGPCSRFHVRRLPSGRLLLVNHKSFQGRNNLTAMLSEDDGLTWSQGLLLDARREVSYPDMAEVDGALYIIYDYNRTTDKEILLAKITEEDILAGKLVNPASRLQTVINKATGHA